MLIFIQIHNQIHKILYLCVYLKQYSSGFALEYVNRFHRPDSGAVLGRKRAMN